MREQAPEQLKPLYPSLQDNITKVLEELHFASDIVLRELLIGTEEAPLRAALFYTEGLVDTQSLHHYVMEPLMLKMDPAEWAAVLHAEEGFLQRLKNDVITVAAVMEIADFDNLFTSLLSGNVILLFEGLDVGFLLSLKGWETRAISEPSTESIIRGPRDSFTETLRTNTALIRRRIRDTRLRVEQRMVGRSTKTDVAIMYIEGIANEKVVEEVRTRLDRIDLDSVLESSFIEEEIQDRTATPFPTIFNSERPDVVSANLLEGRVAIVVDGTPFVLTVPALFVEFFQSADDYYQRSDISTLLRFLRLLCFFIALIGPSLYIAITTFHQEMLPTQLLISLAAQREGVPFPAFIEALVMEITFEILREAGVRMPRAVGQAMSIVGTLVIGTAAVDAGIVSAAMVIVVSITAISNFVFPAFNMGIPVRMLRFVLMGLAASFGIFGIIVGLIALVLHLCSLRSFGVPYMSPLAPIQISDQKDVLVRVPRWMMLTRPHLISSWNNVRQKSNRPKQRQ
ncbi:spore germination protein [Brevibacillus fluminis]|uniref:spore germination protein n=1 Tax=Brevibacillus fluminis TaxID=511487 RepID=UPI003F8BC08A